MKLSSLMNTFSPKLSKLYSFQSTYKGFDAIKLSYLTYLPCNRHYNQIRYMLMVRPMVTSRDLSNVDLTKVLYVLCSFDYAAKTDEVKEK